MRIGELSEKTGFTSETIRYYEREGLLPKPERSENNYRCYTEQHLGQLLFIRRCRQLDMALHEIRSLLALRAGTEEDCANVNALLEEHLDHVQTRIGELRTLEEELKALRAQCLEPKPVEDCGILQGLLNGPDRKGRKTPGNHVPGSHG